METILMSRRERHRLEVFSRVRRGEITVVKASELLGLSYRQAKRCFGRYRQEGEGRRARLDDVTSLITPRATVFLRVSRLRPIFTSFQDFDYETAIWDSAGWSHDRKRLKNVLAENQPLLGSTLCSGSSHTHLELSEGMNPG
jgi:hypothetical protein